GTVKQRNPETVNKNIPTGEMELVVEELRLLNESKSLPFLPGDAVLPNEEMRLKYRYIDLRRDAMQFNIEMRHKVSKAIRDYLSSQGFFEIETPFMTRSTPEGARDYLVPSRVQPGYFYALPQSPQLFKQILMISGFDKYFQIVRCFRDEDLRADRQPEFTQLDMEMSFVEEDDVINVVDGMLQAVLAVAGIHIEPPLDRITYDEAMLRYGTDKPDRRVGMEIQDLGEAFRGSQFKVFAGALESGGVVRGLRAGAEFPRARLDELTELAKSLGAKGLVWATLEEGGEWRSPVAKFLGPEERARAAEILGANQGDTIFAVADRPEIAARVLGALR